MQFNNLTILNLGYIYDFEDISGAVEKGLNGSKPAVHCVYDKMLKASVVSQISICLSKGIGIKQSHFFKNLVLFALESLHI